MKRLASLAFLLTVTALVVGLNTTRAQNCPTSCPNLCTQGGCSPIEGATCPGTDYCAYTAYGCPSNYIASGSCCLPISPVIIDVNGDGIELTNARNGVLFRANPFSETAYRIAWTRRGTNDAWLALDRNGNGQIDDIGELFGNLTHQSAPAPGSERNGFAALAEFDSSASGGNGDGMIDARDRVFHLLRLWRDRDHDGVSTADELTTLPEGGIDGISLRYQRFRRIDDNGNEFRFRAMILRADGSGAGKWAWDVYLRGAPADSVLPTRTRISGF